jgi:hypothetical protein
MKADIACESLHERDGLVAAVDDRALDTTLTDPASNLAPQGTFGYSLRIKPERRVGDGTYVGIERRQRH